jgi:hypothetical protein
MNTIKTPLKQNGDFRSDECIEILKESDIIVTNPPFSLFIEHLVQLVAYDKRFLIIGSLNAIAYKEIFKLIKSNKLWLGYTSNSSMSFKVPSPRPINVYKKIGGICWFTNLTFTKEERYLPLYKTYSGNEKDYPKYDNYDAINVNRVKDIPMDYMGVMGVPISFLCNSYKEQFELLGSNRGVDQDTNKVYGRKCMLNEKETFKRLFIKRREV